MSDFFTSFCWLWDFLLEKMKLRKRSDHVHWYARNNISKKEFQIRCFESFIFWAKVHFFGTSLGLFSQFFFVIFCSWSTMVADIFTQPRHHEKSSYSPGSITKCLGLLKRVFLQD